MTALDRFEALLDTERTAALAAAVDVLASIQSSKAEALAAIESERPSEEQQAAIVRKARANVVLLRQLVELQRSLLAGESTSATYGRTGALSLRGL